MARLLLLGKNRYLASCSVDVTRIVGRLGSDDLPKTLLFVVQGADFFRIKPWRTGIGGAQLNSLEGMRPRGLVLLLLLGPTLM